MKPVIAALAAAALAACAPVSTRRVAVLCPSVPACVHPAADIQTNADLARAYLDTGAALDACKLARDTLQACIDGYNAPAARP